MPFNGSGTFTIVNTFIPNTTILSSAVNTNFSDIATGLSDCLTRDGQVGMTAALKAIAGTAGAPSITFSSDTSTGMYLISAGNLGLTSNGALALQLNSFQVAQFQQAAAAKVLCVLDTGTSSTSSTINSIATAGTGAIAIGTATNWPSTGYLMAGNEIMTYTATAGGLVVNSRGEMGTTSVSHATGATITFLDSALDKTTALLPARATASRSSFPAPGELAFNSGSSAFEGYNGTAWTNLSVSSLIPQGYLSPTAGVPIITSDAVSQTSIFYNPYKGNLLPVPTNGVFTLQTFTTSAIALSASQTTAGIYDIYGFISTTNSTLTFGISPSWAAGSSGSVTPGSCARGTGAGGTALTYVNGYPTNAVGMTILNGANSYTIATSSGLYLGSVLIGATAGTVNLHRVFGQTRQWGIWNNYNRVPVYLKAGETTASWTYNSGTIRPSNNTTANKLTLFSGLQEDTCEIEFMQGLLNPVAATGTRVMIGINSTGTASGVNGWVPSVAFTAQEGVVIAKYQSAPLFGTNEAICLEAANSTASYTFFGTEANMMLNAKWRA